MNHSIISGLTFAFAIACSPAPAPVAASLRDPSNPNAPEGTTPAVVAPSAAPPSAHDEHHHHEASPDATIYVCPMHPEVTSSAPGTCPKCNMKLVPKK